MQARAWIVVATLAGSASLAACGADRDDDEQRNLAILRELPVFPNARELEVTTAPYYGDEEGIFDSAEGHTTTITYTVPTQTTQRELVRFFRSRLAEDWECNVERGGGYLLLLCSSDVGSISVNPDNLATPRSGFEVVADHRDGSN
jgi:hypothetical protein